MKGKWIAIAVAALFLLGGAGLRQNHGGQVAQAAPPQPAPKPPAPKPPPPKPPAPKPAVEQSYWQRFQGVFVNWDDNAPPGAARTEVTGVKSLNVEQALGSNGYDWAAVDYMEKFSVSMEQEKSFLESGRLGPYQAE